MKISFKSTINIFTLIALLTSLLGSALSVTPAYAAVISYAKPAATGTGDCLSWANACTLQTALTEAIFGEVWVAAGTHKPGAARRARLPSNL